MFSVQNVKYYYFVGDNLPSAMAASRALNVHDAHIGRVALGSQGEAVAE